MRLFLSAVILLAGACATGMKEHPAPPIMASAGPQAARLAAVTGIAEAEEAALTLDDPGSCMAAVIYHEARGEAGEEAKIAIGHVVLNRQANEVFPDTVCGVVKDGGETPPCQFSWWCDGRADDPGEEEAWAEARRLAREILSGRTADPTGGAVYFFTGARPAWTESFPVTARIGRHTFLGQ